MSVVRRAEIDDLDSLLALFRASEVSVHAEPREQAERIWTETLPQDSVCGVRGGRETACSWPPAC